MTPEEIEMLISLRRAYRLAGRTDDVARTEATLAAAGVQLRDVANGTHWSVV